MALLSGRSASNTSLLHVKTTRDPPRNKDPTEKSNAMIIQAEDRSEYPIQILHTICSQDFQTIYKKQTAPLKQCACLLHRSGYVLCLSCEKAVCQADCISVCHY